MARFAINIDVSARNAIRMLGLTDDALNKLSQSIGGTNQTNAAFQQAMSNLATGLGIVQSGVQQVTEHLTKMREASITAFRDSELALSKLDIAMGRVGTNLNPEANNQARQLAREFDSATEQITRLAQTTEFTFPQITALIQSFIQSGLPMSQVTDTMEGTNRSLLSASVAMASASAGAISLEDAGQMLLRSVNSIGAKMGEIPRVADFMIRAINNSAISFHDMEIIIRSLSGVQASYLRQTRPEVILALAGALRAQGRSAAEASNDIIGFGRSVVTLISDLRQARMRNVRGLITTGRGRFSKKLFALSVLGISSDDLIDETTGEIRDLEQVIDNIRARVRALREGTSEVRFRSRGPISQSNLVGLRELGFELQEGTNNILRSTDRLRSAGVDSIIKAAFGAMIPVNVLNSVENLERRYAQMGGELRKFNQLSATVGQSNNELADSQARRLDTLEGQEHLRESALFELERQIGQITGNFERLRVEVERNLFGVLGDLLREDDAIRGFAGSFLILTENIGKAVLAITAIGLAVVASMNIISASHFFTAGGTFAGALTAGFGTLAGIILPLIGSIAAFSFVVYVASSRLQRLSSSVSSFEDAASSSALIVIKEFGLALKDIILPLLLGQKRIDEVVRTFGDLSMETKATVLLVLRFGTLVKAIFKGFVQGITFSIGIMVDAFDLLAGFIANVISYFTGFVPEAEEIAGALGLATDETTGLSGALKPLLQIIGAVLGPILVMGILVKIAGLSLLALQAPLFILKGLFKANTLVIAGYNLVMKAAVAIHGFLTSRIYAVIGASRTLSGVMLRTFGIIVLLFFIIKGLIKAFKYLVARYKEAIDGGHTLWAIFYGLMAVLVAFVGVIVAYTLYQKLAIIFTIIWGAVTAAAGKGMTALALKTLLVIGAILLLIAALSYLFGGEDLFSTLSQGAERFAGAIGGIGDASSTVSQDVVQTNQSATTQAQEPSVQDVVRTLNTDSLTLPSSASGEAGSSSMPSLQNMSIPQSAPTPVNITISSTVPPNREQLADAGRTLAPFIRNALNRAQSV